MGPPLSKPFKISRNHPAKCEASKGGSQELDSETPNVTEYADESDMVSSEWEVIPSDGQENGPSELQRDRMEFPPTTKTNREVTSKDPQKVDLQIPNTSNEDENGPSELQRDRMEFIPTSNLTNREVISKDPLKVGLQIPNTSNNILERNLLNSILKYCNDWESICEKLGFDKSCFYKKSRFVECFTWLFWKTVLRVYKNGEHEIITYIEKLLYVNIDYSFWDLDFPQFLRKDKITDFPKKIWEYIPQLERLLQAFNIDPNKILKHKSSPDDLSDRILELIGLNKVQSWSIWKHVLLGKLTFGGPQIIEDIENDYPYLRNIKCSLSADEMIILKNFLNDDEIKHAEEAIEEFSKDAGSSTMETSNEKKPTLPHICNVKVAAIHFCEGAEEEGCEDILEAIADKIDDVSSLSSILGFEETSFENPLHLIQNVTWLLWKFILNEDLSLLNESDFPYLKNNTKFAVALSNLSEQSSHRGAFDFLKQNLAMNSNWKEFGDVMGVPVSKLEHLEDQFPDQPKDCVAALMRQHCYPFNPVSCFNIWLKYLLKFDNGRKVINRICDEYRTLIHPKYIKHTGDFNNNLVIMHHDKQSNKDILKIEKFKKLLVPISKISNDPQSKEEFSETTAKYHHRYEMICNVKKLDFSDEKQPCLIFDSIEEYLVKEKDDGFVYKGYSLTNHCHLLADGVIPVEKPNNIIAYISKDRVLLHIKFCEGSKDDEKIHSIRRISSEFVNDVRLAQSLHPCIQNNPIIHVGVVVCDKSLISNEKVLCKDCKENGLLIEKEKISSFKTFSDWYQRTVKQSDSFKGNENFRTQSSVLSQKISTDLKENIIIYMVLDHYRLFPLFTNTSRFQMNELKKLVYLTGCQMKIFYSPFKHKVIRGGYGSGKSIVLEKLFEATMCNSTEDVIFYICYDQMSKFHLHLQSIFKSKKQKNVFICNIQELSKSSVLKLSSVLKQIKKSWKSRCCHFFIDEFNGSQLTKKEVDILSKVLLDFKDSHINIAVQSFEYKEIDESSHFSGFQYDYLKSKTDFELFELDYSLRCSKQINNFVNDSIQVLRSSMLSRPRSTHPFVASDYTVMDQEMADDRTSTKYHVKRELFEHSVMFSQPKDFGHNVQSRKVQKIEVNESLEAALKAKLASDLENNKLFNAVLYFLREIQSTKIVICAFNEVLYAAVNLILEQLGKKFTGKIEDYLKPKSPYEVLLIDHASPRGFEFEHFMFVFGMERIYMNYRLIECFTRATTNLYLVVNVEEQGIKENKVAQNLIELWRKHPDVNDSSLQIPSFYIQPEANGHENTGSFIDPCKNDMVWTGEDLSDVQSQLAQVIKKASYRWSNAYQAKEIIDDSTDSDVNHMMESIFRHDNDNLFQKYVLSNEMFVTTYCRPSDKKSFLHIAVYHNAVSICKLLVEKYKLKVNESFNDEPTPLEDAIKYSRIEIKEYFLQHIEILESEEKKHFEKLIKVAKN